MPAIAPNTMRGVQLRGHGGLDMLEYRDDLPTPTPSLGEVLIRVLASSVNNTDVNTRIGWYSKAVRGATSEGDAGDADQADSAWSGAAIAFPRIQGADCCGEIVAVGTDVDASRVGERVLWRAMPLRDGAVWTMGSDCDGGFAEYAVTRSDDAIAIHADVSATALGAVSCAYTTAEGMLQRAGVGAGRVLVTGASGGVGLAAVQLAKRRGATVSAIVGGDKAGRVRAAGADETLERDAHFGRAVFDHVVDLVAGPRWGEMIDALVDGGAYVTAGAIAGPIVELDVRTLYLRDLSLFGSTAQPANILPDVVGYLERGEITPIVSAVYDLADLPAAQEDFMTKRHVGKIAIRVAADAD